MNEWKIGLISLFGILGIMAVAGESDVAYVFWLSKLIGIILVAIAVWLYLQWFDY